MSSTTNVSGDAPIAQDNTDYELRDNQKGEAVPVVKDSATIDDPINAETANSDEQLAADDKEAIDESNIVDERTRGSKPEGSYVEPGDEEGLPANDGTSAIAQ